MAVFAIFINRDSFWLDNTCSFEVTYHRARSPRLVLGVPQLFRNTKRRHSFWRTKRFPYFLPFNGFSLRASLSFFILNMFTDHNNLFLMFDNNNNPPKSQYNRHQWIVITRKLLVPEYQCSTVVQSAPHRHHIKSTATTFCYFTT